MLTLAPYVDVPEGIPFDQGYAAFYLAGVTGLNIGFAGAEHTDRNRIFNMRNGIVLLRSVVQIAGTDIYNLEGDVPRRPLHPFRDLNQVGVYAEKSMAFIKDNTFTNLMVGANTLESVITIQDNSMTILT